MSATDVRGASIMDVARALEHALGLPVMGEVDGRVLTDMIEEGLLSRNPAACSEIEIDRRPVSGKDEDVYSEEDAGEPGRGCELWDTRPNCLGGGLL